MIQLTRLNGTEFIVNAELIKFIESTPDTVITLRDGEKLLVKESPAEVVHKAVEYGRSTRHVPDLAK